MLAFYAEREKDAQSERHDGAGVSRPDIQGCGRGIRACDGIGREIHIRASDDAVGTAHLLHSRPGGKSDRDTLVYKRIEIKSRKQR